MSAIRFSSVGLVLVFAVGTSAIVAGCSSSDASSAPPSGGGTGGFQVGGFGNGGSPQGGSGNGGTPQGGTGNGGTPQGGSGNGGTPQGGSGNGGTPQGGSSNSFTLDGSTVTKCPDAMNPPAVTLPACTLTQCTLAHCVPTALIPAGTDPALLATCDDPKSKCVPDAYIAAYGKFLPKTCTSLLGAEGRCISSCIPQVAQQYNQLPKDSCADSEKCAPCFNPIDGTDTHACSQGCDTGPVDKTPKVFADCGAADSSPPVPRGKCVPKSLVPADLQSAIPKDTCTGTDELCAPTEKAKDLNYKFPTCQAAIAPFPAVPGACVPKYVGLANPAGGFLVQGSCQTGDLCAPCTNPLDNTDTGACK